MLAGDSVGVESSSRENTLWGISSRRPDIHIKESHDDSFHVRRAWETKKDKRPFIITLEGNYSLQVESIKLLRRHGEARSVAGLERRSESKTAPTADAR